MSKPAVGKPAKGSRLPRTNATTTFLCWNVGRRLLRENLPDGRAASGERILATLSQELPLAIEREATGLVDGPLLKTGTGL